MKKNCSIFSINNRPRLSCKTPLQNQYFAFTEVHLKPAYGEGRMDERHLNKCTAVKQEDSKTSMYWRAN